MANGSPRIGWAALLIALALGSPVLALDPQRAVTRYNHTRWTVEGGASAVEDLAQTKADLLARMSDLKDGLVGPAFYKYRADLAVSGHVFRARAAKADGVWNEESARVVLELQPTLFQSSAFQWFCAALVLALLIMFFQWRMGRLRERLQASLRDRIAERERIARELHDTLLQGVQGLILTFQSAARQVPADLPARNQLERAIDRAEAVVVEARDRVRSLRISAGGDLMTTLKEMTDSMRSDQSTEVITTAVGRPIDLHPLVADEVERIVVEALFNAHRHAQASRIEVIVAFESKRLRINIRDNGIGIEPAVLDVGGRDGHFGLAGMRERARKIRASLTIRSSPGAGADIELVAPGAVAYARRRITLPTWLTRSPRRLKGAGR